MVSLYSFLSKQRATDYEEVPNNSFSQSAAIPAYRLKGFLLEETPVQEVAGR